MTQNSKFHTQGQLFFTTNCTTTTHSHQTTQTETTNNTEPTTSPTNSIHPINPIHPKLPIKAAAISFLLDLILIPLIKLCYRLKH